MNKLTSAALVAALLAASTLAAATADPGHGNGNGNGNGHGNSAAAHSTHAEHAHAARPGYVRPYHVRSSHSRAMDSDSRGHSMSAHRHYSQSRTNDHSTRNTARGNSSTAHNCVNPAGHTRGWCKGSGTYRGRYGDRVTSISGTVTAVNGNTVTFLRDNGTVVTVLDNNGTVLNVGGHYTLTGTMVNGQFVLGSTNNNYGQSNQTVSGTILSVGDGTVTLIGLPPTTINVQQAINNGATNGSLTVGRSITAYGYYSNNVFYATAIQ